MDDDEFDEQDILAALLTPPPPPVRRLRPLDLVVWASATVADLMNAASRSADMLAELLVGHANYGVQQHQFEDAVRADLEYINDGDE